MKCKKNINPSVIHINIRSIRKQYHSLLNLITLNNYDIICLSETLLKPFHPTPIFPGYECFRKDILKKKQRGVAILIKSSSKVKILEVDLNRFSDNIEVINIKVQHNFNKSCIFSCTYRHPVYSKQVLSMDIDSLESLFKYFLTCNTTFFSLGDFNLRDNYINMLDEILAQLSLHQLVDVPTRQNQLLDLIITNSLHHAISIHVFDPFLSDHKLTECKITFKRPAPSRLFISSRPLHRIKVDNLISDLNKVNPVLTNHTSMSYLDLILNTINETFNIHAPINTKNIPIKQKKKFISAQTKLLMRRRNSSYSLLKRKPSPSLSNKFTKLKCAVKASILRDTKNELDENIKKYGFWSALNQVYPIKSSHQKPFELNPDDINDFFVSTTIPCSTSGAVFPPTNPSTESVPNNFTLMELSPYDITQAWRKMKKCNSRSVDPLNISPLMIDQALGSVNFLNMITVLFNTFIKSGDVPSILKTAKVIPIPKIKYPVTSNDLRPISIQPVILKLFEKCLQLQLSCFLDNNHIISTQQFGFRKLHSTCHALTCITDFIYNELDNDNFCILISLDLRKAFDKVDRTLLLNKMKNLGIDSDVLASLLHDRKQYVSLVNSNGSVNSLVKSTVLGVAQGGCISSLFFSLLINDLPNCIRDSMTVMFADDTNLIISGQPNQLNTIVAKLEADLIAITEWMIQNRVEINEDKTKMLVLAKPYTLSKLPNFEVRINNTKIVKVETLKVLGLTIDPKLEFTYHANLVSKKCNSILFSYYPIRKLLSMESKLLLVNAYVLSSIDYVYAIWGNGCSKTKKIVDKILRSAARFIYNVKKFDPISHEINHELEWLNPKYRHQYETLKFAFKIVHNLVPDMFLNYLLLNDPNTLCTRNKSYVSVNTINNTSHKYIEKSVKFNASKAWINLPDIIKNCTSFKIFKKLTMSYLLTKQLSDNEPALHDLNTCTTSCDLCTIFFDELP